MTVGRREFLVGAAGAFAAARLFAFDERQLPDRSSSLVLDSGPYATFGPNEKWIQAAPAIAIDTQKFGADCPTLRMTSTNGAYARGECQLGAPKSKLLQVDFYLENPDAAARLDVTLSSNDFTGWMIKPGSKATFVRGWNRLQFSIHDCTVQGSGMTPDDWDKITKVWLTFFSKPGTTATIWVGSFQWLRTKAAITFTWDDGREGCLARAMPIMLQYDWASTIYVVTDAVGKRPFKFGGDGILTDSMNLDQLNALQDAGWDVASHTCTHPDLTKVLREQKQHEMEASKEWLVANGFSKGARFFATPYGKRDAETQEIASKLYVNLRDASAAPSGGYETPLNLNGLFDTRYQMRFQEVDSGGRTPISKFHSWVDNAIASGTWLLVVGHSVDNIDGWMDPDWFRRALRYLDERRDQIDVLSMSQYWDRRNDSLDQFSKTSRLLRPK